MCGGKGLGPAAGEPLPASRGRVVRDHTSRAHACSDYTCLNLTTALNRPCLRWFLEFFTGCGGTLVLYSRNRMSDCTETLAVGSRAPEFLLSAANRDGILSLSGFLSRGSVIVEFLRGTW